ncbi:MAG: hypothetical protein P8Z73_14125, partial [Desulfobacteraceae bacterium]
VVMGMVTPAMSEDKPADTMGFVQEKVRADKKLFVAENMQLTDAEAKAFWPIYDRYQDEQFLLHARAEKLIKDFAAAYEQMTDDTARQLLDEFMTIEFMDLMIRQVFLPEFRKVLPESKVARYYQSENKIKAVSSYELAAKIPLMKIKN